MEEKLKKHLVLLLFLVLAIILAYLIVGLGEYSELRDQTYTITVVPVDRNGNLIDTCEVETKITRTGDKLNFITDDINRAILDSVHSNHNSAIVIKPIN